MPWGLSESEEQIPRYIISTLYNNTVHIIWFDLQNKHLNRHTNIVNRVVTMPTLMPVNIVRYEYEGKYHIMRLWAFVF